MAVAFQVRPQNLPGQSATRKKLFSNGCLMCLKRRVKCDEGKPGCARCDKLGLSCPGYRNTSSIIFLDVTSRTENKAKAGQTSRSRRERQNAGKTSVLVPLSTAAPIEPALIASAEQQGLCFFVDNYVFPSKGPRPGYLDFVPGLMMAKDTPTYFKDVVGATGMAALAIHQNRLDLLVSARKLFGKALAGMGAAMKDPKQVKSDLLIAASFMSSKYENLSGDSSGLFESHGAGQLALIKSKGPSLMATKLGQSLWFLVSSRATTRGIVELEIPDIAIEQLVAPESMSHNPMAKMQRILASAMLWMVYAKRLVVQNSESPIAVVEIIKQLLALDEELEAWYKSLPPFLAPLLVDNNSSIYAQGVDTSPYIPFLGKVMIFQDTIHSGLWARYATGRIQLLRMLYLCLTYCQAKNIEISYNEQDPPTEATLPISQMVEDIKGRLQELVHRNCTVVPFMLGHLKNRVRHQHPLHTMAGTGGGSGIPSPVSSTSHTTDAPASPIDGPLPTAGISATPRGINISGASSDLDPKATPFFPQGKTIPIVKSHSYNVTATSFNPSGPGVTSPPQSIHSSSPIQTPPAQPIPQHQERVPGEIPKSEQAFGTALSAFWLMWTLYPAGLVTCLPAEYYPWIEQRLLEIGHLWGVKQALHMRYNLQTMRGVQVGFSCFPK